MAYPNPYYDPKWEERHASHAVERDRAQQEETSLIAAGHPRRRGRMIDKRGGTK
jgi:hypothetical protein